MGWWQSVLTAIVAGGVTGSLALVGVRMTAQTTQKVADKTLKNTEKVADETLKNTLKINSDATLQRDMAAKREELWRRFVWAAESSMSDKEDEQVPGLQLLIELQRSPLAQDDEVRLMYAFAGPLTDRIEMRAKKSGRDEEVNDESE